MNPETIQRLLGARDAFAHPVTCWITGAVVVLLAGSALAVAGLRKAGRLTDSQHAELRGRIVGWWILAPALLVPILAGAAWVILAVAVLSVSCYREYARVTGFFRHPIMSASVVVGILVVTFAVADHWYGFFAALPALGSVWIASVGLLGDQPKGYLQRVALGLLAFLMFGVCLGHLGYMANDRDYRPLILMLLLTVELNDVWAYLTGKRFGRRKLAPRTSPNKTVAGALGALMCTTATVGVIGHFVFQGSAMDHPARLIGLGVVVSLAGQMGDLMLSSIKRDIGIKDTGVTIPGHGGLLDRFDSLILAAPAVFHYVGYFRGYGLDQTPRIFTG